MSVGKDSILRAANADAKKTEVKVETKPAEEVKAAAKAEAAPAAKKAPAKKTAAKKTATVKKTTTAKKTTKKAPVVFHVPNVKTTRACKFSANLCSLRWPSRGWRSLLTFDISCVLLYCTFLGVTFSIISGTTTDSSTPIMLTARMFSSAKNTFIFKASL